MPVTHDLLKLFKRSAGLQRIHRIRVAKISEHPVLLDPELSLQDSKLANETVLIERASDAGNHTKMHVHMRVRSRAPSLATLTPR